MNMWVVREVALNYLASFLELNGVWCLVFGVWWIAVDLDIWMIFGADLYGMGW